MATNVGNAAVPLRKRPDLIIVSHRHGASRYWEVKDPVKLQYFRLGSQEHFLLEQLDGQVTLSELRVRFNDRHMPAQISVSEIEFYLQRLYELGLVISLRPGQGTLLFQRARSHWWQSFRQALLNPFAIRLQGTDASFLLKQLDPISKRLFHPGTVLLLVALTLFLAAFTIPRYSVILLEAATIDATLSGAGLGWLLATIAIVKVCHELGHGLAARHFGSDCREVGIMLLMGTPCLYCNVSDVWMIPNKWQRMVVAAAGMYVELWLAALSLWVWLSTVPGIAHALAWNIVVVCSVSTLLLNINPLLRYDGYYILSDWLNVPNLGEQSQTALWGPLERWLAGNSRPSPRLDGSKTGLVCYGILSFVYRIAITVVIGWSGYRWLQTRPLQFLGPILIVLLAMQFVIPGVSVMARVARSASVSPTRLWHRWVITSAILLVAVSMLLFLPLPMHVRAPAVMQFTSATYLRAPYDGRLVSAVADGAKVRPGDVVFELENLELQREVQAATGEVVSLRDQLTSLQRRTSAEPELAIRITSLEAAVEAAEQRRATLQGKRDRLKVSAVRSGIVVSNYEEPATRATDAVELPYWSGSPLSRENLGCYVRRGELICLVGDPDKMEAWVQIRPDQVDDVSIGSQVTVFANHYFDPAIVGEVAEISLRQRSGSMRSEDSSEKGANSLYRPELDRSSALGEVDARFVRVRFHGPITGLGHNSGGVAKIAARPTSLGNRFIRYVRTNFRSVVK